MSVSVPFTGGCACGAIRYTCSAAPLLTWNCHCRDCQRATGSICYVNVLVSVSALQITKGEPTYYAAKGQSGNMQYRGACRACGSPVVGKGEGFPDMRGVSATSLDDPSGFAPVADIWTSSAQPWATMNPQIPKFETQPTVEEFQALLAARREG